MGWRTIVYNREKLYEEVWAEPVSIVAKRYGVSNVALAKTCRKLSVPLPGRGYWARERQHKKVHKPPLPVYQGQTEVETHLWEHEDAFLSEIDGLLHNELKVSLPSYIPVSKTLHNPHPLVKQTQDAMLEQQLSEHGLLIGRRGSLDLSISRSCLNRGLRVYNALINAMTTLGWNVQVGGQDNFKTSVTAFGERIEFRVEEQLKQTDHILTADEERDKERWPNSFYGHRYDYHPTGLLSVEIREYGHGLRKKWSDTERSRLEEKLADILQGIRQHAAYKRAERRELERKAREREATQARYAELQSQQEAEQRRITQLESDTEAWYKAERIRQFVVAVKQRDAQDEHWIKWALAHADRVDPLRIDHSPEDKN